MRARKIYGRIFSRMNFFPYYLCNKITFSENLVAYQLQICLLVIVDTDENSTSVGQQFMQQLQSRIHHTKPFVVAGQIFAFLSHNFTEPFFDIGIVYVVVVNPFFVARIIRRIYINAINPSFILRKQRF